MQIQKNPFLSGRKREDYTPSTLVFHEEELHGIKILNRFHYLLTLGFAVPLLLNVFFYAERYRSGVYANVVLIAALLLFTITHSIVIEKCTLKIKRIFSYLMILFDFFISTAIMLFWNRFASPDNYAFILKLPTISVFSLFITITLFQFRLRLIVFSCLLSLTIYYTFVFLAIGRGTGITDDWYQYILGPDLVLTDVLSTRPIIFTAFALCAGYIIKRIHHMLRMIGKIESEKQSLSRYFSPEIAAEITSDPETIKKGRRQTAVILFTDIRDFTEMSEAMEPEILSDFLTFYRRLMGDAVFVHHGIVDKYIGDAVMAVFGVPHSIGSPFEDCLNAYRSAQAMWKALALFNLRREGMGKEPIRMGMGMHMGEVFAGAIGSENQLEYSVIGDTVNTASRIESLCKTLDASFLISKEVYNHIKDQIKAEELPPVQVKGKEKALIVYKVK